MTTLVVGKSTTSRNASATLAFHKFRAPVEEDPEDAEMQKMVKIGIDRDKNKFHGKLYMEVSSSFVIMGPPRDSKPEAVLDGLELGRMFVEKGSAGARTLSQHLKKKTWSAREIHCADEEDLKTFVFSKQANKAANQVQQKLIPPGEGWVRHNEDMLVYPQGQVYFVQVGKKAGKYLTKVGDAMELCDAPHSPQDHPLSLSAASASWVRRGAKLDRAVLLNDITKIARLALKFPLSFVDTPACAYALFQGLRSAESAQWCAENFHKKLFPLIAEKIHTYGTRELQGLLCRTLEALDAELQKASHAYSGCCGLLALVLGNRVVIAGVGQVRAVLLPAKGRPKQILACAGGLGDPAECERVREAGGWVHERLVHLRCEGLDDAGRILAARHPFDVLQLEPGSISDTQQVRSAYRRLALRVHPDKKREAMEAEKDAFKRAFSRLDTAKEALEAMLNEDIESCAEIHKVLCSEIHSRAGAASLLGVDKTAMWDTDLVVEEAERASKAMIKRFEKMRKVCPQYDQAVAICQEAVETLRRGCSPEALPRQEALLREGLPTGRAMGARDLRSPYPVVTMTPESASQEGLTAMGNCRLALLCGATAELDEDQLAKAASGLSQQPKATALKWCLEANATAACSSAVCIRIEAQGAEAVGPPAKRQKAACAAGPDGTIRLRHILLKHKQLRQPDPMARREGVAAYAQEAEETGLKTLEKLLKDSNQFLKLCRELSDCESASQPGTLAGDLGWIARGQLEQALELAAFALRPNELGDIVTTSRGVHIIQRLA